MNYYIIAISPETASLTSEFAQQIQDISWARLSRHCFVVETELDVQETYDRFRPLIGPNASLYIISVKKPWFGGGGERPAVDHWLARSLTWQ